MNQSSQNMYGSSNQYGGGYYGYPPMPPFMLEKRELRHTSNILSWTTALGIVSMNFLTMLLQKLLLVSGYRYMGSEIQFSTLGPVMYHIVSCVAYLFGMALPFLICMAAFRMPVKETIPFEKVKGSTALCCIFMGAGVCMLANIPANMASSFLQEIGFSGKLPQIPQTTNPIANVFKVISVVIIPPLVEELAFRGVILSQLRRFGDGLAIFGSAILFGLFHGNFIQIPFAFLVGLIMAFIMVRTNNLWITIGIHMVNNGISVAFDLLRPYLSEKLFNNLNSGVFTVLVMLAIVSALVLIIKEPKFFSYRGIHISMPFSMRVGAFVSNPGFLIFLVLSITTSIAIMVNF